MKIFVSHSFDDGDLLSRIKIALEPNGLEVLIAKDRYDPLNSVTEKIKNLINQSNICLVLYTENGHNSKFVQQEIGYITNEEIPLILLVEKGLEKDISGFIYGKDFISYDPKRPDKSVDKIMEAVDKIQDKELDDDIKAGMLLLLGSLAVGMLFKGLKNNKKGEKNDKKFT